MNNILDLVKFQLIHQLLNEQRYIEIIWCSIAFMIYLQISEINFNSELLSKILCKIYYRSILPFNEIELKGEKIISYWSHMYSRPNVFGTGPTKLAKMANDLIHDKYLC